MNSLNLIYFKKIIIKTQIIIVKINKNQIENLVEKIEVIHQQLKLNIFMMEGGLFMCHHHDSNYLYI